MLQIISTIEYLSDTFTSQDYVDKLERRIERLENFLNKIMPMLPDEIKLYLEVSETEVMLYACGVCMKIDADDLESAKRNSNRNSSRKFNR